MMQSDANLVRYFHYFTTVLKLSEKQLECVIEYPLILGVCLGTVDVTLGHQCHKRANRCH